MWREGQVVERYVLGTRLGRGGQAEVWAATDRETGRRVVVKRVDAPTEAERQRALDEARHHLALDVPELVRCARAFELDDERAVVLELERIDGVSVAEAPSLAPELAGWAVHHVTRAACALHARGIVHRDITPSNVLLTERFFASPSQPGVVRLIDLGIARKLGSPRRTEVGTVVGTLASLAPEQLAASDLDHADEAPAVDVFAIGVLGWMLWSKHHPAGVDHAGATWEALEAAYGAARAAGRDDWQVGTVDDPRWTEALRAMLALDPATRPRDASEALARLPAPVRANTVDAVATSRPRPTPLGLGDATEPASPPIASTRVAPIPAPRPAPTTRSPARPSRRAAGAALAVLAALAMGLGWIGLRSNEARDDEPATPSRGSRDTPDDDATSEPGACAATGACVIDRAVTLGEYLACEPCGPPAREATSPIARPGSGRAQATSCAAARGDPSAAMTCVSAREASRYCAHVGLRLPTLDEAAAAQRRGRLARGATYEWTSTVETLPDPAKGHVGFHRTVGPGMVRARNPTDARDANLGFRCAR